MNTWLRETLLTIKNNSKLSNSSKEEFKRFLIHNFKSIQDGE